MGTLSDLSGGRPRGGRLEALTSTECWRLLASRPVGRIGFTAARGPQILPVNHAVHDRSIVFRTAPYNSIAENARDARIAIEVDAFDEQAATGWSVLAVGLAVVVHDADELVDLWGSGGAEPWAPGSRPLYVRMTPDQLSGRRIHAS